MGPYDYWLFPGRILAGSWEFGLRGCPPSYDYRRRAIQNQHLESAIHQLHWRVGRGYDLGGTACKDQRQAQESQTPGVLERPRARGPEKR